MLKKAGIVVAAAAAALLAVSPLAFAGDKGSGDHGNGHGHHASNKQVNSIDNDRERSSSGIVNVDALNGDNLNNVNVCPNVEVDVLRILSNNALGLLGQAQAGGNQTATCSNDSSTNQSNS